MKKRFLGLSVTGMAAFMDIAMGAFIATLTAKVMGMEPTWVMLVVGGISALLPDFDVIVPLLMKDNFTYDHHTTILHRPIIVLPVVTACAYLVGGAYWGSAIPLCVLWHYIHDTWPLNVSGLAWFWPITDKYVSPRGFDEPIGMSHTQWREVYWHRPSPLAVWEIGVGIIALPYAAHLAHVPDAYMIPFMTAILLDICVVWISFGLCSKSPT